jgi:hypothetical protein
MYDPIYDIIPLKFQKYFNNHKFCISEHYECIELEYKIVDGKYCYRVPAFWNGKSHVLSKQNDFIELPLCTYFVFIHNDIKHELLINELGFQDIVNALRYFPRNGGHIITRYTNLYKAYEILVKSEQREIKYSSIRHSLSHAIKSLTDQRVIDTLMDLFGTININLDKYKHKRILFKYYCELMIDIDIIVREKILEILPDKPSYFDKIYYITKKVSG